MGLWLLPSPRLRPRLTPGSPTAMVWATTAMDTPAPTDTMADGTARGLLRPSPRLMPTPTCCTEDTAWDTTGTGPTATPTPTDTTARGLLMPSPRPSPTTTVDTTVATPVPTTVDTATEPTGDR